MKATAYAKEVIKTLADKGISAEFQEVQKTNTTLPAIIVNSGNIRPTFYIDTDKPVSDFVDFILNYEPATFNIDDIAAILTDREELLKAVNIRLVNADRNQNDIPAYDLQNGLKAQFYINVDGGTIILRQSHIEEAGTTTAELYRAGIKNMSYKLQHISELIPFTPAEMPMYIITNSNCLYGAACILADGVYDELTDLIGDFVILPSSVHEVIAVPAGIPEYRYMVQEVNQTAVETTDFLSDEVYTLTADGRLTLA